MCNLFNNEFAILVVTELQSFALRQTTNLNDFQRLSKYFYGICKRSNKLYCVSSKINNIRTFVSLSR